MSLNVITAAVLAAKVFPSITYTVPRYIAQGVTLLAGKPKVGKSWLALNIAEAIASGGSVLGEKVEPGDVLYLALEDNERRLQRRLDQMIPHGEKPERLHLVTECKRLDDGGLEAIEAWCDSVAKPRMIVVDVLTKVRPVQRRNESPYNFDYRSISPLKGLADQRGIAVLVLHHLNKRQDVDDPFDAVSSTTGLTGAADSIMILAHGPQGPTLYGRGRDIEEIETALQFDKERGVWNALGDATEVRRTDERKAILKVIEDAARWLPSESNRNGDHTSDERLLSSQDIAAHTGMKHANVKVLLGKMVRAGEVVKAGRGKYCHPSCTPVTTVTKLPPNESNPSNRGNGGIESKPRNSQRHLNGKSHPGLKIVCDNGAAA
jgi:AAA domain